MNLPPDSIFRSWRVHLILASLGALLVALFFVNLTANTPATSPFFGDPALYERSMDALFAGQIPYISLPFEHMPLSILPMAITYLLAKLFGINYILLFALGSVLLIFAIGEIVERIGNRLGLKRSGKRWVWMIAPILPLVMFRVDALSVTLAIWAALLAIQSRPVASFMSIVGGILAKGWPVVGAASSWWRGKRQEAAILVVGTALLGVALLTTPGFRSGRSFSGIHQETLIGAVLAMTRSAMSHDPGLVNAAGAVYVEVGRWAVLATLAIGAALAIWSLRVLRTRFSWIGGLSLTAALTFSLILGSPLLSAQFILWPMPFVALSGSRNARIALSVTGGLSMFLVGYWLPGSPWWHGLVVVRNLTLLITVGFTMRDLRHHTLAS